MFPIQAMRLAGSGVTAPQVDIFNTTADDTEVRDALAKYELNSSGAGTSTGQPGWTWLLLGSSSDYQVFAVLDGGDLPTGSFGSWVSLGTTRSWYFSIPGTSPNSSSGQITITIRRVSDLVVIDSAVVVISAEVT